MSIVGHGLLLRAWRVAFVAALAFTLLVPGLASAQPTDRPVRILVGFAPGGTADIVARLLADKLKDSLGAPIDQTWQYRGSIIAVMRLMIPPLPAASQPSSITTLRRAWTIWAVWICSSRC